jgi:hypothetical protein
MLYSEIIGVGAVIPNKIFSSAGKIGLTFKFENDSIFLKKYL